MSDQDIEIITGTTFDFDLEWQSEDDSGVLASVDITGCNVDLQVRSKSSGELLLSCDLSDGVNVPDPTNGQMFFHIAPSKTVNPDFKLWQDARWGVRVTFPSDDAYSLAQGWVKLQAGACV